MKIAFLGSLPAAAVLPLENIRERDRVGNHPAPWIVALLPALARISGFKLRMVLVQRSVLRHCLIERDGVEYEGVPYCLPERFTTRSLHLPKSWVACRALRRFQPDLVHAFGMETGAATIALRSGFPVSCFIQGIVEFLAPLVVGRPCGEMVAARWCESRAVERVRWFVAENEFARRWALGRNPAAQISLIPHPLRQNFLACADPTYQQQIIAVGGLDRHKGMDTVLKGFARVKLPDARLCIVGSGALELTLRELAGALGISSRVDFTGSLESEDVIKRMNRSTALVIGSRMDTSPNVISEAHAIGLPVIGTRVGGIPEMLDEGRDGYVVTMDDDQAMGLRMEQLLSDPEACRRMGEAGREKVKVLNEPEAIAQAHVDFFQRIREDLRRSP